MNEIAYSGLK